MGAANTTFLLQKKSMGDEEVDNGAISTPIHHFIPLQRLPPSSFLEIECKSSGKIRRFSQGAQAAFAVQRINQLILNNNNDPKLPLASYIEAVKEGEEPITFDPQTVVVDYGDGWKLQTVVVNKGIEGNKCDDGDGPSKDFPGAVIMKNKLLILLDLSPSPFQYNTSGNYKCRALMEFDEAIRDDVQSATDVGFSLPDHSLQEENRALLSEQVSDIESQCLDKPDFTNIFTTDRIFDTRDELINWTREVGRSVGIVVTIKLSQFGSKGRTARILFACERFGHRRECKKTRKENTPTRKRSSKRCNCPFVLRGIKLPSDDQWKVKVDCGHHNHPVYRNLQGSSAAGRLTPEEHEIVKQMLKAGIRPKEILRALKERDKKNESTIQIIYNARTKLRSESLLTGTEKMSE